MTFRLIPVGRDGRVSLDDLPEDVSAVLKGTTDFYDQTGFNPPWIGYLALDGDVVVGGGAFVGPPAEGRVEIAYFTRVEHQGSGHAGKTAAGLIAIAREARPGIAIFAKTGPEAGPSPAILTRLGFRRIGSVEDHEIGEAWAWLLT